LSERRGNVRYRIDQPVQLRPTGQGDLRWARVRDVSVCGLALRLCGEVRPGSRLTVEFLGGVSPRRSVEADVVHATNQGDGIWLVGCRLAAALEEEEVRRLAATQDEPAVALVVEGDAAVRKLLANILRFCGLAVLEASSGEESMERLRGSTRPVGLAFIDVRAGGQGGVAVLAGLKRICPKLNCCLMNGDASDERPLLAAGACCVLRKPFSLAEVTACLRFHEGYSGRRSA
jgi:CheY-like chemotaxis protein